MTFYLQNVIIFGNASLFCFIFINVQLFESLSTYTYFRLILNWGLRSEFAQRVWLVVSILGWQTILNHQKKGYLTKQALINHPYFTQDFD